MRTIVFILALATIAYCGTTLAHCQELPNAPEPQRQFWDKPQIISQSINFGITAADVGETCWALSNGNYEVALPTQNCGNIAAILFAERLAGVGVQYLLYRTGKPWALKVSRLLPFVPYTGAYGSASNLAFSLQHRPK